MQVISIKQHNYMPLAKFNKTYKNTNIPEIESTEVTKSGIASRAYLGKNISFGLSSDAGFLISQSGKLRCAYSNRPLITPDKFRTICADLADRTNAQSAVNRLKQYESYMGNIESSIFYTFEEYKNKGKKDFQNILQELLPDSLANLKNKQKNILKSADDLIDSTPEPLKTQLIQIRDSGLEMALTPNNYFGRRTFLKNTEQIIDEKFKPFVKENSSNNMCKEIYKDAQEIMNIYVSALNKLINIDDKFKSPYIEEILKEEYRKLNNCEPTGNICIKFWKNKDIDDIKAQTIEEIRKHSSHSQSYMEQSAQLVNLLADSFIDSSKKAPSYEEVFDTVVNMVISDISILKKLDIIASKEPEQANNLREIYKRWYTLPRSTNDYDAFVVKYSKCSHKKITTDLLRNSVGMVQKINTNGTEKLGNYILVSSAFNNESASTPLKDVMELYPQINVEANIQGYIDNVSGLMRQEKSPFRYRTSYLSDLQSNIMGETDGNFRPEINKTSGKEQKTRKKNSGKRNTSFSINKH